MISVVYERRSFMKILKNKIFIIFMSAALLIISALIFINSSSHPAAYRQYDTFMHDAEGNKVTKIYLSNSAKISIELKDGTKYETDNPRNDSFKEEMLKKNIIVSEQSPTSYAQVISVLLFITFVGILIAVVIKKNGFPSKSFLSVDALDVETTSDAGFNFDDVAGNEEAKQSVRDIVDFLKSPEKYAAYGARMPKGIILYGEPGTGKTLLAKAVAGEANVPFYAMSGSDFIQVYVGVGASRIRQLFKKARAGGKAVIFIDEIDAIGKTRDNNKAGGSEERDQTLNALLTEMSGFNEKEGIIVMAATNRLDMLDPALLRPGRFDRHIEIRLPDLSAREKILKLHLKNKPCHDILVNEWAKKTPFFSGAKLENLVNEAAIFACKENSRYISDMHMDKAYSIIVAGYEKIDRTSITENDKKITAYHEVGHVIASLFALPDEKISKVTIIPGSKGSGGYTMSIPKDEMYYNKDYLMKRIMVLLGGRAAEEIIFGKKLITTGASSDLKQSTNIIMSMITEYGMGTTIGLLNFSELSKLSRYNKGIVIECKETIDRLYDNTKKLLNENRTLLEALSEELIEKETLYCDEIKEIAKKTCS